jgi:hypothetical protein
VLLYTVRRSRPMTLVKKISVHRPPTTACRRCFQNIILSRLLLSGSSRFVHELHLDSDSRNVVVWRGQRGVTTDLAHSTVAISYTREGRFQKHKEGRCSSLSRRPASIVILDDVATAVLYVVPVVRTYVHVLSL